MDAFRVVIERAKSGDEEAFASLFRLYQPALNRYLRVVAGEGAEDLASDVWLDIVRGLRRFEGDEAGFRGWIFTIARRRHIDRRRADRRRPVSAGDEALPDVAADDDPQAAIDAKLGLEAALALVSTLPPDQAEVVALRAIGGLDVATVARIVGKKEGAVRVLAHRGLKRLAQRASPPVEV